jgi:hypothetical protein
MHRPSILLRCAHRESRANEESADRQFEKEEALLELKRQKHACAMKALQVACGDGDAADKAAIAEELRRTQAKQLRDRDERAKQSQTLERQALEVRHQIDADAEATEIQRSRTRREADRAAAEYNRRAADAKKRLQEEDRRREIERDNANLAISLQQRRRV